MDTCEPELKISNQVLGDLLIHTLYLKIGFHRLSKLFSEPFGNITADQTEKHINSIVSK